MVESPYAGRLQRFRQLMQEQQIDSFLVAVPENRYYLSGYEAEDLQLTESSGYLLINATKQFLLTDFRYEEAAKEEAPEFTLVIYRNGLAKELPDLFAELQTERLGIESHFLTHRKFEEVQKALAAVRPKAMIAEPEGLVERLRVVKEEAEIAAIKASLGLTEKVLSEVWENLRPGQTEMAMAWMIERLIREGGGSAVSFPPIVAAGPRAALPHGVPSMRRIEPGEPVILDLGAILDHYCSDMTRTWVAGTPAPKLREIYTVVREAQLAAQEILQAGKNAMEIDATAREVIRQAGYGEYFGHGLGHGVGIAVHEEPRLSKYGSTVLEENMVVTVEPGIYLPGFGGVRLENMARVTRSGCEILNGLDLFYSW